MNINLCIIGFNRIVSVLKDWDTKTKYNEVFEHIGTMNHRIGHGDNDDYNAMHFAYNKFETAPKGKNILIMLSDGYPAMSGHTSYVDINGKEIDLNIAEKGMSRLSTSDKMEKVHLHNLVNSHKDVISIGIGIREGGWQIPNHSVIKNISSLKSTIIDKLKKNIKRG